MKKSTVVLTLVVASIFSTYAQAESEWAIGAESRSTYTRWYEYPGRYWEEDFSLYGLRGEFTRDLIRNGAFEFDWGLSAALYAGSYKNSPGKTFDAKAIRVSAIAQSELTITTPLSMVVQLEVPYFVGLGSEDKDKHTSDFGVYFPSMDLGVGLRYRPVGAAIKSVSLLYGFTIVDLGVSTDMYYQNDVVSENWANSAFTLMLGF